MRYTAPPSPVEAFRRVSSKIGRKTANSSNEDDSNHRLLDHSSWDQSDELRDDDILPFNPTGKFVKKTTPMSLSNFGTLKSPRSMKTLISRVNAVVEHNSYFGNHESRDDDESNVGLLSRDGQYETRYENQWSDAGEDDESYAMQTSQSNNGATTTQPLLPDLVDLGGFSGSSESTESSKENEGATAIVNNGQEHDGSSFSNKQSLDYIVESVKEVPEESQEEVADVETSSTIDFDDEEETRVTAASAKPASLGLNEDSEIEESIELEGSSSTVDFDDDLPLAAEHPESIAQDQSPVEVEEVEEESEKKSIMSSPTDTKSYVSYSRNECPVVISSSEYGDVILLSPKGFENIVTAEATPSVSTENEKDSQDLSKKFEAIALADPSMISRQNFARETDRSQQEVTPKADSDDEDEFVISDDWSEDNSVGNSSDPFGECFVNEAVVQTITEHRQEDNTTSIGREKIAEEEVGASNDDEPTENRDREPLPEASIQLADLETSQLTNKSSSSTDLASFNQIWEGSAKMSESGSDSEECDESRIGDKMSNDDDASLVVSRELIAGFKNELSTSGSSEDDKVVSSDSDEKDSFVSLNNYWSSEWNELTLDDSTNHTKRVQASALNEEDVEEDIEVHDKYSTAHDEEDSDDFYGCGIVEGSYSYDSYGLETISEEEEFEDDESARSGSRIGVENSETLIPIDESKKQLSVETEELVSQEADKNGEEVKECNSVEDRIDAEEDVTAATKSCDVTTREVILVETVNEDSSAEDESRDEEEVVQTTTSNHDLGVQSEVLHQLWTQIDEYQASSNISVEAVEQAPRQAQTKAIIPVKKHAVVKHSMRDRSPSPRAKKAGSSADRTFDDLSKFLDGEDDNDASLDYLETSSNATEVLLDDGSDKIDAEMKRTSVKRHVFTRLFAPVSALVTRRRASQQQDLGPTSSGAIFRDGEAAFDDDNVESDDDRQARELTELLSAAMMARDLEKMNKSAASAKHVAEIREAMAIEQELAEIEGDLHYGIGSPAENSSSSDEDDSQIEILDEEIVSVPPTDASSNDVESKELHDLWTKIDEYHANGKSLNTTQVSMMAELLNSQMEEQQTSEDAAACKSSTRPLRSSKHAVSIKKRAVVNAKAKKTKYDVSYIEAKSIVKKNNAIEEVVVDLVSAPEPRDTYEPSDEIKCPEESSQPFIDLETNDEIKCPEEPSQPLIDLETQDTYESADLDAPPQLCLIPSGMSINSFASIVSEDKSSESSLGDVSKARSDMSKGSSLVSKLYSDNADLAETLATTQCELEKALKQIETMKMEKESQEKVVQSKPAPSPKSSFDEYFEEDMSEGEI